MARRRADSTRGRIGRKRSPEAPALCEALEERMLLTVIFTPGPLAAPTNRADVGYGGVGGGSPIEPMVRVNPTDPGNIVLTSQQGMQLSSDAGGTFGPTLTFPFSAGTSSRGDTGIDFDHQGTLFWSMLSSVIANPGQDVSVTRLNPVTGAQIGTTFDIATIDVPSGDDKPYVAADRWPNSPFAGRAYLSWTKLGAVGSAFSFWSPQTNTWSVPVTLSGPNDPLTFPSTISVAPNGDVYVAFMGNRAGLPGGQDDGMSARVIVRRSTDGGETFERPTEAFPAGTADVTTNSGGASARIPGTQFWAIGAVQPWILADPVRPGNVYVITADDPDNTFGAGDDGDVVIARSTDNGATWTRSTISSGPNNSFQLFPTAAIDRFGNIVVGWYDNRAFQTNGNGNWLLDFRATYSTDGGLTWQPSFRVNDQPFDPDVGSVTGPDPTTLRIGEYFGSDLFGGTAYVAFNGNTFDGMGNPNGQQVVVDSFAIRGSLTVLGSIDQSDTITVRSIVGNTDFVEVIVNGEREYAGLWEGLTELTISAGGGNNTIRVESLGADTPLTINTGSGADTFLIGAVTRDLDGNIFSNITINGGRDNSNDQVFIIDDDDGGNDTYTINGSTFTKTNFGTIAFNDVAEVILNASDFHNTININSTPQDTIITINAGDGDDTIRVGNDDIDSNIRNDVVVRGEDGADVLLLEDELDAGNDNYFVTSTTFNKFNFTGTLTYQNIEELRLTANPGNNNIFIDSTPNGMRLVVSAMGGNDRFFFGDGDVDLNIRGDVELNGGFGDDELRINDQNDAGTDAYTLSSTTFTKTDYNGTLTYAFLQELVLNANDQNNTVLVQGVSEDTAVTINGGGGDDNILVGHDDISANILSELTVNGGPGNDQLFLLDRDDIGPDSYFFTETTFDKFNFLPIITFEAVEELRLDANDQDNNIFLDALLPGITARINGRDGDDLIRVGDDDIDSTIHGDVIINGGRGNNLLVINDAADTNPDSYLLTPTTFSKDFFDGTLTYSGIDRIRIDANPDDNLITINGTAPGTAVTVNGGNGNDIFSVITPSSPVTINGQNPASSPGDRLNVTGAGMLSGNGSYTPSGTVTGDGVIDVDGQTITFTGLEPVTVNSFANFTLTTPNGADVLTIDSPGVNRNRVRGSSGGVDFESLTVFNVVTLIIDTAANDDRAASDDQINISPPGMVASNLQLLRLNTGLGDNTLLVRGGTTNLDTNLGIGGVNLRASLINDATVNLPTSQTFAAMSVSDTALLNITPGGGRVLRTSRLVIEDDARVDLNENDMIVDNEPANALAALGALEDYIGSARNMGAWDMPGLTSSAAAAQPAGITGLGIILNRDSGGSPILPAFGDQVVDENSILVKYSWNGDLDLNGLVDIDDYFLIDLGFLDFQAGLIANPFYRQGDLDFNDIVDIDDYFLIDLAFLGQDQVL